MTTEQEDVLPVLQLYGAGKVEALKHNLQTATRVGAEEILRLRSRVEELEGALKNAEPIAELLRTVSSFLDGWIFADIKPDGEQIQREADGLRTDVDVALAYSPVFSALSPSKDEFLAKHLTELQNENPNAGKLKKATV